MFGLTQLTPEEKIAHTNKKRKEQLQKLITEESAVRQASLDKASEYMNELESIGKIK
jgi:hypothetical protein